MAHDIRIGRTLGPYEIEALLGGGGMATVYRGVHRALGVQRAIKIMSPGLATRDSFVELFYREARLAAGLRHPNIVQIFDIAEQDGLHFLVMELLEGQSLQDLIRREAPLPLSRVGHFVGQLADALDYAHHEGIAHRDVKPANAFVGPADVLTLVDFGIARAADGTHLTVTHGIGTPEYMAPEVFDERLAPLDADDHTIGVGTDLYSLGVVTYVLVTGKVPFPGRTPNAVAYAQVNRAPRPPRTLRADLPVAVEAVMLRQLAKRPGQRYPSAQAFSTALAAAIYEANPADAPPTFHSAPTAIQRRPARSNRLRVSDRERTPAGAGVTESGATAAVSRGRWLVSLVGLLLLVGAILFAETPSAPWLDLIVDPSWTGESRAARGTMVAAASTPTSLPLPTATATVPSIVPTIVPTAAPPSAPPERAEVVPTREAGPSLEQQADEAIAQAIALAEDQNVQNADLAVERLDRLRRELDPVSTRRPVVEEVMIRVLVEDSHRRVRAAFVLKNANAGRESQRMLSDARQRFDRAAQVRPHDDRLQDRVKQGREQAELTSLWVDFDTAYYARQNDAQIAALSNIMARSPDFKTAEGPAKEKLYAAWISKAVDAWDAKQAEQARLSLDEAIKVDPDHPRARELRAAWFPQRAAPVRAAQPRRAPAWEASSQSGQPDQSYGAASLPESQPAPPAPRPQQLVPQGDYHLELVSPESNGSNQPQNDD